LDRRGPIAVISLDCGEQGGDIGQGLDPDGFIRVKLPPDLLFEREYQAQVGETVPRIEASNGGIVGNGRRIAAGRLSQ
jgi:hypothetical protein